MQSALSHLLKTMQHYSPISEHTWQVFQTCLTVKSCKKGEVLYSVGSYPSSFCFIHKGLIRAYALDEQGTEFNKNFFPEGRFPGCMTALLNNETSFLSIEALEDCELVEIDYPQFRQLLFSHTELMTYHIKYLEQHWVIEKEPKEIGYLQFEAKQRYQAFLEQYQNILHRIPQYHIASFLGITPTQLSRIKKSLN